MAKPKPPPKADDKEQSKRFIEKAREIEADESGEAFERAFKKIVPSDNEKVRRNRAPSRKASTG